MTRHLTRLGLGLFLAAGYLALVEGQGPVRSQGPVSGVGGGGGGSGSIIGGTCGAGEFASAISSAGVPTCGVPAGGGDALTSNPLSQFAATTSAQLAATISNETGTGLLVFATSPTFTTPILGTPTSGTLTNTTGFPVANLAGAGTGVLTFLATPSSANFASAVTGETGSGAVVFGTSPTIATPVVSWAYAQKTGNYTVTGSDVALECATNACIFTLPSAASTSKQIFYFKNQQTANALTLDGNGANIDGSPTMDIANTAVILNNDGTNWHVWASLGQPLTLVQGDLTYASAANTLSTLAKNTTATRYLGNTGSNNNPAWTSIDLATGVGTSILPTANGGTGLSTLGTGIATWWATPSSANFFAAITDETGAGLVMGNNSPVFVDDFDLMATGVRMTGTDGTVTLLGLGNGNDEDLTIDFDNGAANAINLSSSTGVTAVNLSFVATSSTPVPASPPTNGGFYVYSNTVANGGATLVGFQGAGAAPSFRTIKGRGTTAAPRRALNGDFLANFAANPAYAASDIVDATLTSSAMGLLTFTATEDQTVTNRGNAFSIYTALAGTATASQRFVLSDTGMFVFPRAGNTTSILADFEAGSRVGSTGYNTTSLFLRSLRDPTDSWFNSIVRFAVHDGTNSHNVAEWVMEGQIDSGGSYTNGPWLALYDFINDKTPFIYDTSTQFTSTSGLGFQISASDTNRDGVRFTAADGVLTILGIGNGNDENIVIDFDNATANTIAFTSGTGVTSLVFTGLGLNTSTSVTAATYSTATNCSDSAGAAACSSASAGQVVIDAAATTVVVSTTAVTANSEIFIQEDPSAATRLSITCNTTTGRLYTVTARTAGTSFTITASAAPVTNPACLSYRIVN